MPSAATLNSSIRERFKKNDIDNENGNFRGTDVSASELLLSRQQPICFLDGDLRLSKMIGCTTRCTSGTLYYTAAVLCSEGEHTVCSITFKRGKQRKVVWCAYLLCHPTEYIHDAHDVSSSFTKECVALYPL